MRYSIHEPSHLTEERCSYWAALAYWHLSDLVLLSMGLDPSGDKHSKNDNDEAAVLGRDFEMRLELVRRASNIGQLETILGGQGEEPGSYEVLYPPFSSAQWAMEHLPTFPSTLYEALLLRHGNKKLHAPTNSPNDFRSLPGSATLICNNAIGDLQSPMERMDSEPRGKNTEMSAKGAMAHTLRNECKATIREYVKEAILPPCTCNHAQMARYIAKVAKDPKNAAGITRDLRNGKKISDRVLLDTVRDAYLEAGADVRIKNKNQINQRCNKHGMN